MNKTSVNICKGSKSSVLKNAIGWNMKFLRLNACYVLCFMLKRALFLEDCKVQPECHVFEWQPWSMCSGYCGLQTQHRNRHMCCQKWVFPHTAEHCLQHCNRSSSFLLTTSKPCRICENGGTLNQTNSVCKCSGHYKGNCCQGEIVIQTLVKSTNDNITYSQIIWMLAMRKFLFQLLFKFTLKTENIYKILTIIVVLCQRYGNAFWDI